MPRDADNRLQKTCDIIKRWTYRLTLLGIVMALTQVFLSESPAQTSPQKPQPFVLDGTKWTIVLTYVDAKGKKQTQTDALGFSNRKIISEGQGQKGYAPTNYSISARADGVTTFGTMQVMQDETSYWKGEISEDKTLQGSLHVQDKDGNLKEYSIEGRLSEGTLMRKGEKPPEATPSASETVVADATASGRDPSLGGSR